MYQLKDFSKVKIVVIGDVMVDKYLWGDVTRVSPEAPVPVVRLQKTSLVAGGAANVAANAAALGATVYLIGVVGDDVEGANLAKILEDSKVSAGHLIKAGQRPTTVKTRIIAHNQQIARIDLETHDRINRVEEKAVWEMFCEIAPEAGILVISDYAKGVLSDALLADLINYAKERGITVVVDPKGRDYRKYRGATVITPNKFELAEVGGCRADSVEELSRAAQKLVSDLGLEALVITRGEQGMTLIEADQKTFNLAAVGRKVFDVTGAGDTFISTLAVALGAGENYRTAAAIANIAAGLAVETFGTTTISFKYLKENLDNQDEL